MKDDAYRMALANELAQADAELELAEQRVLHAAEAWATLKADHTGTEEATLREDLRSAAAQMAWCKAVKARYQSLASPE